MNKIDKAFNKIDKAINDLIEAIKRFDYRYLLLLVIFATGLGIGLLF